MPRLPCQPRPAARHGGATAGRHHRRDRRRPAGQRRGIGYRRIGTLLDRPLSTVRRWIRASRDLSTSRLRAQAVAWLVRVDRDVLTNLTPQPTRLGEALTALTAAAVTLRARSPRTSPRGR